MATATPQPQEMTFPKEGSESSKDQICEMCGNIGFPEALVTCCQCKRTSEHIYCMRDQLRQIPEEWYCEVCLEGALVDHRETHNASESQRIIVSIEKKDLLEKCDPLKCSESPGHIVDEEQQRGAHKYLHFQNGSSPEMLNDYKLAPLVGSPGKDVMKPFSDSTLSGAPKPPKRELPGGNVTVLKSQAIPSICGLSDASLCRIDQEVVRSLPVPNITTSSSSIQVLPEINKGPGDADVQKAKDETLQMAEDGGEKDETSQKAKDSGAAFHSNSEFTRTGFPETNHPLLVVINPDGKLLNCHAPQVCWEGTFEIFDVVSHIYSGMRAHLPAAACMKVYDISKTLPKVLKFKLFHRNDVWPKIFQLDPPTKDDIGLYFFPCELPRPKEKYLRLLERLNSRNLAMKSCMNDVQLLLFTSDHLPIDSQRIDVETYLWGVFHHMKHLEPCHSIEVETPSYNFGTDMMNSHCHRLNVPHDSCEEVDMEVDMVGGKEVGRVDKAIPRVPLPPFFSETDAKALNSEEKSCPEFSLEKVDSLIHSAVPPGFSNLGSPAFTELVNFKHQSSSIKSTSKSCTPSRTDMPIQCACSPETNERLLSCAKQSPVKYRSEKVASPIYSDVPPGFSEVRLCNFAEFQISKQSSSPQSTSKSCIPSGIVTAKESSGTPYLAPETNTRDLNCVKRSSEKVACPIPPIPPVFSELGQPNCPKILSSKHDSSSLVSISKGCTPSGMEMPIQKAYPSHCSSEANVKEVQRPLVKFSLTKAASTIRSEIPSCFSYRGPPCLSEISTSKHVITSPQLTSKGCIPSRMETGSHISSGVGGCYAAPEVQSEHHEGKFEEQASDYHHMPAMHLRSNYSIYSAEIKKEWDSFSSSSTDTKLHPISKKLRSPFAEKKVHRSPFSEERRHDQFERSRYSRNTPEQDVQVCFRSNNLAPERGELEFERTGHGNMVLKENEVKKEVEHKSGISRVQKCEMTSPYEAFPMKCKGRKMSENEGTLDLPKKKQFSVSAGCYSPSGKPNLPLLEAGGARYGVHERKEAFSDGLVFKEEEQIEKESRSKLDSENKIVSSVATFYNCPSSTSELHKDGLQGHKTAVSYRLVADGDKEAVEKGRSQSELNSEDRQMSLVFDLYNSPSRSSRQISLVSDFYISPSSSKMPSLEEVQEGKEIITENFVPHEYKEGIEKMETKNVALASHLYHQPPPLIKSTVNRIV